MDGAEIVTDSSDCEVPTVILMGGLPASGKTTLARQLVERYTKTHHCVVHLEYDAIEDSLSSTAAISDDDDPRRQVWNETRHIVMKRLEEYLSDRPNNVSPRIFLIDDNFHLRGMRKKIHRLLLGYKPIRFGILWMETPLEECVRRNHNRIRPIPSHVMEKMNQIIEVPRSAWEEYCLKVDQRTSFDAIIAFVDECADISDLPVTIIDERKQEADRQGTLGNQSHNWDNLLRGWVRKVALYDKTLAVQANVARKEMIREMKQATIDLCEEDQCLRFVSLIIPNDESGNQSRLLQLLKT